jgi:hypothetical protein
MMKERTEHPLNARQYSVTTHSIVTDSGEVIPRYISARIDHLSLYSDTGRRRIERVAQELLRQSALAKAREGSH